MAKTGSASVDFSRIRGLALDVDGVLTDGGIWWGPDGEEWKRFCFADVMGVSLARRAGIVLALISGEDSPLVDRYAKKMHILHIFKGRRDKGVALLEFAKVAGLELADICYMGDDLNDLPAMRLAGISAAPANVSPEVLAQADFVAGSPGGNGAVRALVDAVLSAKKLNPEEIFREHGSQPNLSTI